MANVIAAFRRRVEAVTWMSPATKRAGAGEVEDALLRRRLPGEMAGLSGLRLSEVDAVGNQRTPGGVEPPAGACPPRPACGRHRMVDHAADGRAPCLLFQQNAYNFSAALLQAPKFDPSASDAANYGAIGAIVGHEVSHFVDTLGADYDVAGRKANWWTAEDMAGYEAATEPLVVQFSDYRPFPDLADQRQADADREPRRPRRPCRRLRRVSSYARQQGERQGIRATARTGSSSSASHAAGAARHAKTRCAPRSPRTITPRRVFGLQPFAISMHGTTRSTYSRGSACISSRRRGYASGEGPGNSRA